MPWWAWVLIAYYVVGTAFLIALGEAMAGATWPGCAWDWLFNRRKGRSDGEQAFASRP